MTSRRQRKLVLTKRGEPITPVVPLKTAVEEDRLARLRGTLIGGDGIEDFGGESPVSAPVLATNA